MHSIDGDDTNPGTGIDSPAHAPAAADPQLSAVVVPLLRGVLYREDDPALWTALLQLRARAMDYVAVLALELQVDEAEGYAFLRARPDDDEEDGAGKARLPRLVRRQPLGFQVSLLLALLRKKLAEFDASGGDTRLVLTRSQVLELVRVFLPSGSNESRLIDQVDTHLNKVADLGFVRRLKPAGVGQEAVFEVRRILKAFVDAQWLADFDQRLQDYQAQLAAPATGQEDEAPDAHG